MKNKRTDFKLLVASALGMLVVLEGLAQDQDQRQSPMQTRAVTAQTQVSELKSTGSEATLSAQNITSQNPNNTSESKNKERGGREENASGIDADRNESDRKDNGSEGAITEESALHSREEQEGPKNETPITAETQGAPGENQEQKEEHSQVQMQTQSEQRDEADPDPDNSDPDKAMSERQANDAAAIVEPRLRPQKPRFDPGPSHIGRDSITAMPSLDFIEQDYDADETDFEPAELLLLSVSMKQAIEAAEKLASFELQVTSRQSFNNLKLVITRFRLPRGSDVLAVRQTITKRFPDLILDTNQRYQLLASRRQLWGQKQIEWPVSASPCLQNTTFNLGMIDTAVDVSHPAFLNRKIVVESFVEGQAASAQHGSGIASILVGNESSGFSGLLTDANLYAASVFRTRAGKNETTTHSLLRALEWLSGKQLDVINLSLGGKHNRVFADALRQVLAQGTSVVAAAGNGGPDAAAVYPAAQQGVIAVTAVDAIGGVYASANRGEYIDFSAPGVDIWSANAEKTGQYYSGSSFAAPFVSALFAMEKKGRSDQSVLQALKRNVKDLGAGGKDPVFGWGLVNVSAECK